MNPTQYPTREQFEAWSLRRRLAETMHVVTCYNAAVARALKLGHPRERLQRHDPTIAEWQALPPGEQFTLLLDLMIALANLADYLQHGGSAPAVTVQANGIVTVAA